MKRIIQRLVLATALAFAQLSLIAPSSAEEVLELFDYQYDFESKTKPKVAIIIDDLGYQRESVRTLTSLPFPLTLAVIPFTPYADDAIADAERAEQEVILHVPMETLAQSRWESGLNTSMNSEELKQELDTMLERYPQAAGINNHGGSKLTADTERMQWIMESLAGRDMYYLDSRTTHESKAVDAAKQADIAYASRDVFLDNIKDEEAIEEQFDKLRHIARKRGTVIAIGHPYPETLATLQAQLPKLEQEGFELKFVSDILTQPLPKLASHIERKRDNTKVSKN